MPRLRSALTERELTSATRVRRHGAAALSRGTADEGVRRHGAMDMLRRCTSNDPSLRSG